MSLPYRLCWGRALPHYWNRKQPSQSLTHRMHWRGTSPCYCRWGKGVCETKLWPCCNACWSGRGYRFYCDVLLQNRQDRTLLSCCAILWLERTGFPWYYYFVCTHQHFQVVVISTAQARIYKGKKKRQPGHSLSPWISMSLIIHLLFPNFQSVLIGHFMGFVQNFCFISRKSKIECAYFILFRTQTLSLIFSLYFCVLSHSTL